MKTKQNSSLRASALQITLRITLISLSAALLTLAAAPVRNQIQQKSAGAGNALRSAQHQTAGQRCLEKANAVPANRGEGWRKHETT